MRRDYVILSSIIVVGFAMRVYNLTEFHVLESDEAIYIQAAHVFVAGQMPYRDFFYASPPLFLVFEAGVISLNHSLFSVRFLAVSYGMVTLVSVWYLALVLSGSKLRAHIAALAYAVLPYAVYFDKIALLEGLLSTLVAAGLVFFWRANKGLSETGRAHFAIRRDYLFSGVLMGMALLTKFSAVLVAAPLLLYFYRKSRRRYAYWYLLGAGAIVSAFVLWLITFGLLEAFLVETVVWQLTRFQHSPFEKLWGLFLYFAWVYPVLALILVSAVLFRSSSPRSYVLPLYVLPVVLFSMGGTVFIHYFVYLTPLLCVALAESLPWPYNNGQVRKIIPLAGRKRNFANIVPRLSVVVVSGIVVLNYAFLVYMAYGGFWPGVQLAIDNPAEDPNIQEKRLVAWYINQVAPPGEPIWTSDASIAFLAERKIISANVTFWRFQGFFQDIWAYDLTGNYHGPLPGYPDGLVTLKQIGEGWEITPPSVIVIIRSSGVDNFVWNGISNIDTNQTGLGGFVMERYELGPIISGIGSTFYPSNIEVWVRK